ncbi:MAG TPA: 30S ribosomal protein S20 [Polyangia bacterium]|nr:30S ribosomal protein S20 [Polyangia bacterium]
MANIKSSEKANRQRVKRTARNVAQTTAMRSAIKKLRAAIGSKTAKNLGPLLKNAVRAIDKAASKGVIKKGTASRSVSRLTVAVAGASK